MTDFPAEINNESPVFTLFTGLLPSWKGKHFVLIGIDTVDSFTFLHAMILQKLIPTDSQNALSIVMVLHLTLLFIYILLRIFEISKLML
jgi:hypothetical protein